MNREALLKTTGCFHEYVVDSLRDPKEASVYLQVALDEYQEDNNVEAFLMAIRTVAEAQGGVGALAKKAKLNRQHLYNALSHKGNPKLETLGALLKALGFHLLIAPITK